MKSVKKRLVIIIITVLIVFCVGVILLENSLRPSVDAASENAAVNLLRSNVAKCAQYCAQKGFLDSGLLLNERRSPEGKLEGIELNAAAANLLKACFAQKFEELLNQRETMTAYFPLGNATGFLLFSSAGPMIKVGVFCHRSFECTLVSDLKKAGLNQSLYTLNLRVEANVEISVGGRRRSVEFIEELPVCQRLSLGELNWNSI